ncbi:hypothetical protein HYU12_02890 [Candidatus Woesearchaeota archaeon]|nr:hypothetical protein [Candidatus Woesearchaeota archaeon]
MNKKALLGDFVLKVFTILFYIMFLMIVLIILKLPGCTNDKDVTDIIRSGSDETLQLKVEQQLITYLRTPMPDDLLERIERMRQMDEDGEFTDMQSGEPALKWNGIVDTIVFRLKDGKKLIEQHPEIYKGQTYAGFIAALERHFRSEPEKANAAFDLATRAVFAQKYEERITRKTSKEVYASPIIIVKYDGFNPESPEPIKTEAKPGDLRSIGDSYDAVSLAAMKYAVTLIPTEDNPAMVQLNAPALIQNVRLPRA